MNSQDDSDLSWIARIGQLMEYEMDQEAAGKRSMIERLCEMFFTLAYRHTLCQEEEGRGFMGALADKQICQALELAGWRAA